MILECTFPIICTVINISCSSCLFLQPFFTLSTFNKKMLDQSNLEVLFERTEMLASAVYLQVSTISQALIFVTRSRGFSYFERPGLLLVVAFIIAQLVSFSSIFELNVRIGYDIKKCKKCTGNQ